MAIKIEMLRCFSVVAQCGNLLDAAAQLGRTQSAVSMTLKQLEDHLGQRLFEGERKSQLTPLGEQVFELAQTQIQRFDETVKAMEVSANSPDGLLRIAAIPSVAAQVFPELLGGVMTRHPGLRVELRDTDSAQVVDALLRGQADIGVASGRHQLNGIEERPLFSDRFGVICVPDHPMAQHDTPSMAQVVQAGFIRNSLCDLIDDPVFQTQSANARLTVHNTLSLIAMVRTGRWVTVLPRSVANILPGELVFRPISEITEQRDVVLLLRTRSPYQQLARELSGEITAFYDQIRGDLSRMDKT